MGGTTGHGGDVDIPPYKKRTVIYVRENRENQVSLNKSAAADFLSLNSNNAAVSACLLQQIYSGGGLLHPHGTRLGLHPVMWTLFSHTNLIVPISYSGSPGSPTYK
jgi:hypothetical protein